MSGSESDVDHSMTRSQSEYHSQDSLKQRRERQLAREILERPSVQVDLLKEIQSWRDKNPDLQDESGPRASLSSRDSYRSDFHEFLCWVTRNSKFDLFIMLTIVVNAGFIAWETNDSGSTLRSDSSLTIIAGGDVVFMTIYLSEFIMKVYCEPLGYWTNNYNRFDFLILLLSVFNTAQLLAKVSLFADLTYIRVLRALRALRALRSISFVRQLRVLVNALIKTLASVLNLLAVLLLIMYIFAIIAFYFFGPTEIAGGGVQQWSQVQLALFSLFDYVTADNWTDFEGALEDRGLIYARFFAVIFLFVGHFIFTNLFIGVIINNLDEAQEEERVYQLARRSAVLLEKKRIVRRYQKRDIIAIMGGASGVGGKKPAMTVGQLIDKIAGSKDKTLRHDDFVPMTHLSCHVVWLQTYLATLQLQEQSRLRAQQLHFSMARKFADLLEMRYTNITDD